MKLYFHKDPQGNFGDDINPLLWPKLFPEILAGECIHDPALRANGDADGPLMIGIGTLLNQHIPTQVPKAIMGTGTGYGEPPKFNDSWHVYFTRGPLTAKKLGLDASVAITDGAILCAKYLPLPAAAESTQQIGFMPHCSSARTDEWQAVCDAVGLKYIDPQNSVEQVFAELAGIDRLITEAMHGAILADTFRIPWSAVKTHEHILDFKWQDWCQSLELEFAPALLPALWRPPSNSNWLKRGKQQLKRLLAISALKKHTVSAQFILSSDDIHASRIEQIESQLTRFRHDYKQGVFAK